MCAVPVDGLHKEDLTHEQLVNIQGLLKRRIPTGMPPHSCCIIQLGQFPIMNGLLLHSLRHPVSGLSTRK